MKSFHCIFRSCIYQFIAIFISNIFHATEHRFQLVCSNGTKKNCQNSPSLRLQLTFFTMIDVDHWILVASIMQSIWNEKKNKNFSNLCALSKRTSSVDGKLFQNDEMASKFDVWFCFSNCYHHDYILVHLLNIALKYISTDKSIKTS